MTFSTDAAVPGPSQNGVAYNLAGLAVLVLLMAIGIAYAIDQAGRVDRHHEPRLGDIDPVIQTVAGRELAIPSGWFRFGEQIRGGFAGQVDLDFRLNLPASETPSKIEVTLLPRSRALASSTLLDRVYLHQFGAGFREGVPGLVGKPLLPQEGYQGETVWYDALSPSPFVAKCVIAVEEGAPEMCLRTIHLSSGLAAVVKFEASALPDWKNFDTELARWLGQIGAL